MSLVEEASGYETREDLISFARANGYKVEDSLARWHRLGLLPQPTQRSKGKGRGTDSLYPAGTHRQLMALLRIHVDGGEKRLAHVAWRLWWEGYEIPMESVRRFLLKAARSLEETPVPRWSEKLLTLAEKARIREPLGRIRRHTQGDFPTLVRVVLVVARGTFTGFEDDEQRQIVDRSLGVPEQEALVRSSGETAVPHDAAATLALIARAVSNKGLSRMATDSADDELLAARDELRELFELMGTFGEAAAWSFGRKAYPYTLFRRAIQALGPRMQGAILLLHVSLRRDAAVKDGVAALLAEKPGWDEGYRSWQLIQAMRKEIPQTARVLSPVRFRAAWRNADSMQRLQADIADLRDKHLDRFNAFFGAHPEATTPIREGRTEAT